MLRINLQALLEENNSFSWLTLTAALKHIIHIFEDILLSDSSFICLHLNGFKCKIVVKMWTLILSNELIN